MILDTQPYLLGAILQAFLYSLYLVSLAHVLRWLLYEKGGWTLKRRDKINWILLTITSVVFVFTTVDLAFEIAAQLNSAGGNMIIQQQVTIASISIETATLTITDAILVIRCWLVYQMSWRAIFLPLILWLANIVCMVNWIINYTLWVFASEEYHQRALLFLRLYYFCNFVTNLYATTAVFYRVWRVARANRNRRSPILYRICRLVATTGILYTCTSLPQVVTAFYLRTNLGAYVLCDALNFSIAVITFNLFLVRVGQLRSELSGMDDDGGTGNMTGSIVLTTIELGASTFTTNDMQPDPDMGKKVSKLWPLEY